MNSLCLSTTVPFIVTVLLLQQHPAFWNQTEARERRSIFSCPRSGLNLVEGKETAQCIHFHGDVALWLSDSCVVALRWSWQVASVSSLVAWKKWFPVNGHWCMFYNKCFLVYVSPFQQGGTVKAIFDSCQCCCVRNLLLLCVVGMCKSMWKGLEMLSIHLDGCPGDGVVV